LPHAELEAFTRTFAASAVSLPSFSETDAGWHFEPPVCGPPDELAPPEEEDAPPEEEDAPPEEEEVPPEVDVFPLVPPELVPPELEGGGSLVPGVDDAGGGSVGDLSVSEDGAAMGSSAVVPLSSLPPQA